MTGNQYYKWSKMLKPIMGTIKNLQNITPEIRKQISKEPLRLRYLKPGDIVEFKHHLIKITGKWSDNGKILVDQVTPGSPMEKNIPFEPDTIVKLYEKELTNETYENCYTNS